MPFVSGRPGDNPRMKLITWNLQWGRGLDGRVEQGVGEALMNAARAYAEARGACGLQLETAKTNLAGQALYERLGYVRDELYLTYWLSLANT